MELHIASAAAMEALGEALGKALSERLAKVVTGGACSIFLRGPLGAGKTTLVRGFLRSMGHSGATRSPTYTLVETYQLGDRDIHHFDLYRLNNPEELENLGIRDYISDHSMSIVEWPERGAGVLAPADIEFNILYDGTARQVFVEAGSPTGRMLVDSLK